MRLQIRKAVTLVVLNDPCIRGWRVASGHKSGFFKETGCCLTVKKSKKSINSNKSDQTRALQPARQLRFYLSVNLVRVADDMIKNGRITTVEDQGGFERPLPATS